MAFALNWKLQQRLIIATYCSYSIAKTTSYALTTKCKTFAPNPIWSTNTISNKYISEKTWLKHSIFMQNKTQMCVNSLLVPVYQTHSLLRIILHLRSSGHIMQPCTKTNILLFVSYLHMHVILLNVLVSFLHSWMRTRRSVKL